MAMGETAWSSIGPGCARAKAARLTRSIASTGSSTRAVHAGCCASMAKVGRCDQVSWTAAQHCACNSRSGVKASFVATEGPAAAHVGAGRCDKCMSGRACTCSRPLIIALPGPEPRPCHGIYTIWSHTAVSTVASARSVASIRAADDDVSDASAVAACTNASTARARTRPRTMGGVAC